MNIATGKTSGQGPVGFSAAMLPFLQDDEARSVQRQRVADNYPGADAYYSAVLTLFGQGWDQHRFRFTASGELQPDWNRNAQALTKFTHAVPRRCAAAVSAGGDDACPEHLLEQVRLGEASNREDLVRQSLYRLELIDPNNPELIAARMRYLLRQGDAAGAQKSWND